jgi:HEAT repeat protein
MRHDPAPHDFNGWVARLSVSSCRQRAKQHLLSSGPSAVPALRRGLGHTKAIVRRQCVNILDHLLDEESVPALLAAVEDVDPQVAGRALHAFACDRCKQGACRPREDIWVPKALRLLHHPHPDLRAAAIDALGKVAARMPHVAAALARASRHDVDKGLRDMARRCVGA